MTDNDPPPHPGAVLRAFLKRNNISQEGLSAAMNSPRACINQVVTGRRGLSTGLAIRLAYVTGTDAEYWMRLQWEWKLWKTRQHMSGAFSQMAKLNTKGTIL